MRTPFAVSSIAVPTLLACLLLTASCDSGAPDGGAGARPGKGGPPGGFERRATIVVTEQAQIRHVLDEVEAIGTTLANESVTIAAKVTDTISKVKFEDGDLASAGDILVELTNEEETALLAEAEANVDDARSRAPRMCWMASFRVAP